MMRFARNSTFGFSLMGGGLIAVSAVLSFGIQAVKGYGGAAVELQRMEDAARITKATNERLLKALNVATESDRRAREAVRKWNAESEKRRAAITQARPTRAVICPMDCVIPESFQ